MLSKRIFVLVFVVAFLTLIVGCSITTPEIIDNKAPLITTTTLPDATVGTAYTATVEATDADDDALTFSLVSGPTDMVISGAGVISGWTPAGTGTWAVIVAVTDGVSSDTQSFNISVTVRIPMEITVVIPTFTVGEPAWFTVNMIANSDSGKSVVAYFGVPTSTADEKIEGTLEIGVGSDLLGLHATVSGIQTNVFTMSDVTSDFRGTFESAGTYSTRIRVKTFPGGELLCSKVITFEVIDLVHNTTANRYYSTITEALDEASAGDTIEVAAGTYDGFVVDKDNITIKATGEAIIKIVNFPGIENNKGVVINANGVVIEGLTIDGSGFDPQSRGILGYENVEYTVKNAIFINLMTGIYANAQTAFNVELTAIGNTFTNCMAGIGGTENTTLNKIEENIFTDCDEGIGLGPGVEGPDGLISYLHDNNVFVDCTVSVGDWR